MNRSIINPVLAEEMRGNVVENTHRGALCVVDPLGRLIAEAGNIDAPIFPRSAIKCIQALALFESGAVDKFDLGEEELALACASHHGEQIHVTKVAHFLEKLGLSEQNLECGAQLPSNKTARTALLNQNQPPSPLHHNCSGKHTGMLAVALALGVDPQKYIDIDHPVQQLVRKIGEQVLGVEFSLERCGTDGCSIPTWQAPLKNFAMAFARIASGQLDPSTLNSGAEKLVSAAMKYPYLIAGENVFDTKAMEIFDGSLMIKVGAAGVFCGLLPERNFGFVLKCDDGNMKAAEVMISALLLQISQPNAEQTQFLRARANVPLPNAAGRIVAELKAVNSLNGSG